MRIFWTRVLLGMMTFWLVACIQYPVDFADPSVLRGTLTGAVTAYCNLDIYARAWSPDSTKIAIIDSRGSGQLSIWDAATSAELTLVENLGASFVAVALQWTSDGNHVIIAGYLNKLLALRSFNVKDGGFESSFLLQDGNAAANLSFSANGTRLLSSTYEWEQGNLSPIGLKLRIWDTVSGGLLRSFQFTNLGTNSTVAMSSTGDQVGIWLNESVQIWSVATGLKTHEWNVIGRAMGAFNFTNHDQFINALVYPTNELLPVQFERINLVSLEINLQTTLIGMNFLDFSDDGIHAAVNFYDTSSISANVLILNLETGMFSSPAFKTMYSYAGNFSPNGLSILFSGSNEQCGVQTLTLSSGVSKGIRLQPVDIRSVTLQLIATWQDEKQYQITGTATIGGKTGLTVVGVGYAGDDQYFVNPRTPATRPSRAILEFRNADGSSFAYANIWFSKISYSVNFAPNTFLGEFHLAVNGGSYYIQMNHQP